MKKLFLIFAASVLSLAILCSCGDTGSELSVESIYAKAVSQGYEGSLEEFIAAFRGEPGDGIAEVKIDENNKLTVVLDSGKVVDCGTVSVTNGKDGKDGADGKDGTRVTIGENGNWFFDGVDSGIFAKGEKGQDGADGKDGKDGASWLSGEGAPSSSLGKDGDLYLDTVSFDLYKKGSDAWAKLGNFVTGSLDKITVNEGDEINITVNGAEESESVAAARGMLSSVLINATGTSSLGQSYGSSGSGVIYRLDKTTGDAYIITNYHVVYNASSMKSSKIADNIVVYLYGYESEESAISASYVGGSLMQDIAVLKITGSQLLKDSLAMAVTVADVDAVKVLDRVVVIGNAEGLGMSATLGSVNVDVERLVMTGADEETEVDLQVMRIDAPVNHGNSGGGAFDLSGDLIGIVNAKLVDEAVDNIGYMIPANIASAVADSIIHYCDGQTAIHPYRLVFGIMVQTVPSGAEFNTETGELERKDSLVVDTVNLSSLLYGRLQVGDTLSSIVVGGVEYELDRMYKLDAAVFRVRPNMELTLKVMRGGVEQEIVFTVSSSNLTEEY